MPARRRPMSTRALLRAWQKLREDDCAAGLSADLDLLQAKDLDLSVRLGALLAFDALMTTVAVNPISASPGAPLSLHAASQPIAVALTMLAVLLLLAAAFLCVRALLIGEEFSDQGIEGHPEMIVQRLLAAYCASIDAQRRLIARAVALTVAGGIVCIASSIWIMAAKMIA